MVIAVVAYKFGTEKEIGEHLGTYHYFIEKMRQLVRRGHKVVVIAPWLSFFRKGSEDVDGVAVVRYYPPLLNKPKTFWLNKLFRFWYIKSTQAQILKLDREKDLTIIYVWQARETGFAVAAIKDRLRAPFVFRQITAWQWHLRQEPKGILKPLLNQILERDIHKKFVRAIYQKADRVVFVSRAASQEGLDMGLASEKVAVIGVGIDVDTFQPMADKLGLRERLNLPGDKIVLFIGRINFAEKGLEVLLKAMCEVVSAVSAAHLVIIGGGGESQRVLKQSQALGIADRVHLVGKKSFFELPLFLNASDVLVVPSLWLEHFGQVTIDAMSCGIPVVTSDIGGSPEINMDGQTGFVVPAGDSQALSRALTKLLSDDNLRQNFGENARRRVLENYTYEILTDKFLKLVQDVRS